ncbi:SMI1/KNR4 family protein [Saccharibacillus alkalitolerans]|uniref:Knr4/Smi1-like domain-containing protein n=1 Tax=Saccharibacillus alkalitolerans TaxID=2705290 RepID=A0ABX0F8B6_9BACL|nr:SMI1/KNR4 family protein [Saccharibacillus alkalitolerans]NGZ74262.1 hypothetical protein [Saccharibacillus alkalitolerans]
MNDTYGVTEHWMSFERAMTEAAPEFPGYLNGPASEEAIAETERRIGRPLPEQMKRLYRIHDGEDHSYGTVFGLEFLPLEEAAGRWEQWRDLIDGEDEESLRELAGDAASVPEGAIRTVYASKGWIPVLFDGAGCFIGIDLDPGPAGKVGQIINFGRDEDEKVVLAEDLAGLLKMLAEQAPHVTIEREEESDDEDEDEDEERDDVFFSLGDSHAIDVLKQVAKNREIPG